MQNRKKTKIVATLGPATSSKEVLKKMLDITYAENEIICNLEEISYLVIVIFPLN